MFTFEQLLRPAETMRGRKSDVPVTSVQKNAKRSRIKEPHTFVRSKNPGPKSVRIRSAQALKIAHILGIPADYAQFLYDIKGNGHVYAPEDNVRPNRKEYIDSLTRIFGRVAVVDENGEVSAYTWEDRDNCARMRMADKIERFKAEERAVLDDYRQRKRDELFFQSQQGKPSPKHQGRANSLGDIGKYVNKRRSFSVDEYAAACDRLRSFHNK